MPRRKPGLIGSQRNSRRGNNGDIQVLDFPSLPGVQALILGTLKPSLGTLMKSFPGSVGSVSLA